MDYLGSLPDVLEERQATLATTSSRTNTSQTRKTIDQVCTMFLIFLLVMLIAYMVRTDPNTIDYGSVVSEPELTDQQRIDLVDVREALGTEEAARRLEEWREGD